MPGRPANGELWVGLGTVLFAGIVAWQVALIPSEATYARVGPQAIPWLVAGLLALFGAALAFQSLLGLLLDGRDVAEIAIGEGWGRRYDGRSRRAEWCGE